ncbi:MAG: DUF2807 domain-containing protein [Bacteroidia bacterium]|nr:DUF2807 domain-containing protein [Bacteroidia bacterium]
MKRLISIIFYSAIIAIAASFFWNHYSSKNATPGQTGYNTDEFHGLEVGGAFKIVLHKGKEYDVSITSENEKWLPHIRTEVKNGILHVKYDKKSWAFTKNIKLDVTAPEIRWINVSGAAELDTEDPIVGEELFVKISGAGDLDIDARVGVFTAQLSGTGNLDIEGNTDNANFKISGIGNIDADDFKAKHVSAKISGTGNAEVYASKSLHAKISGAGNISYKGNPSTVKSDVSGAGSIHEK